MKPLDLAATVRAADQTHHLFALSQSIVVGVSGGPDSVALLRALLDDAPSHGLALHVAHVDHSLRPESGADAAFVRQLAEAWGLSHHVAVADVPALARASGRGLEATARHARYALLGDIAEQVGASVVTIAHTADDQAETLMMNLVRGTGLAGLAGMRPLSPWPDGRPALHIARPFLAVTRADVAAYLAARGIVALDDSSNRDLRFLRNRVRHAVMPQLAALNPRIVDALTRLAEAAADDESLLASLVVAAWPRLVHEVPGGLAIDLVIWATLAPAVQRRVLRRAAQQLLTQPREFGAAEVRAVRALVATGPGARLTLPGGIEARTGRAVLLLVDAATPPDSAPPELDGLIAG